MFKKYLIYQRNAKAEHVGSIETNLSKEALDYVLGANKRHYFITDLGIFTWAQMKKFLEKEVKHG